jgi:hypothetical protein
MLMQESVADLLEDETHSTIAGWLDRVNLDPDISTIRLTSAERTAYLPEMFRDLVTRLRNPLPLGTHALMSDATHEHGCLRREQGYTAAMIVEESRMLLVSIFETLQQNLEMIDAGVVMLDVMAIADEVDSQLAQTMTTYLGMANSTGRRPRTAKAKRELTQ